MDRLSIGGGAYNFGSCWRQLLCRSESDSGSSEAIVEVGTGLVSIVVWQFSY